MMVPLKVSRSTIAAILLGGGQRARQHRGVGCRGRRSLWLWLESACSPGWLWLAFVLTYPLGGGVASWLAAGRPIGGLGLGRWPVSMSLAIAAFGLVVYMAATVSKTCELPAAVSAAGGSTAGGREG
jgi:hypothetical protein